MGVINWVFGSSCYYLFPPAPGWAQFVCVVWLLVLVTVSLKEYGWIERAIGGEGLSEMSSVVNYRFFEAMHDECVAVC